MSLLEIREVSRAFGGVVAVDRVSLAVAHGAFLGLIGPNGAGKTTLLRLTCGLDRPDGGGIRFDGRDVTRLPPHRRAQQGMVLTHQVVRPFRDLTLTDNVLLGAARELGRDPLRALATFAYRDRRAEAEGLLARVGIADFAGRTAAEVPLGILKRMQIARALATGPRLLLLDEPLAGLNRTEARAIGDLLTRLHDEGLTLVLIEHNLAEVLRIAGRLAVLDRGRLLAEGEPEAVMRDPAVRRAYLGEAA
ncbi:MAG TPA: ABC transporter ATP-binding protein [Rhodospirillales bacterium]|nr:ABC transporter ATP-binding protein [Rhodospirillales bacterium]